MAQTTVSYILYMNTYTGGDAAAPIIAGVSNDSIARMNVNRYTLIIAGIISGTVIFLNIVNTEPPLTLACSSSEASIVANAAEITR